MPIEQRHKIKEILLIHKLTELLNSPIGFAAFHKSIQKAKKSTQKHYARKSRQKS